MHFATKSALALANEFYRGENVFSFFHKDHHFQLPFVWLSVVSWIKVKAVINVTCKLSEIIFSVWGNPQFSMFSWGVNYGFAYNLPTNSAYFQNPPHDHLTNFPFLDLFPFRDLSNSDEDTATPSTTTTTTTTEVPATDASMMSPDSHEMLGIIDTNASKRYDWDYFLNDNSLNRIKASNVQSPIYYQRPVYEYNNNELPTVISSNIYPVYYPPKIETKPMMQRRYRRDLFKNIESVLNRWELSSNVNHLVNKKMDEIECSANITQHIV